MTHPRAMSGEELAVRLQNCALFLSSIKDTFAAAGPFADYALDAAMTLSTRTSVMTDEWAREILASCIERSSPKADGLALSILHEREVAGAGCITVKEAIAALRARSSVGE